MSKLNMSNDIINIKKRSVVAMVKVKTKYTDCLGIRCELLDINDRGEAPIAEWVDICVVRDDDYNFKVTKRSGGFGGGRPDEEKMESNTFQTPEEAIQRAVGICSFLTTWRPRKTKDGWHKFEPRYKVVDTWGDGYETAFSALKHGLNELNHKWQG